MPDRRNPSADAIVFDLDGVIVDSRAAVRRALNDTLARHGFPLRPPETLDRFIGPPVFPAFAELTGEPEDSSAVAACAETYHRRYEDVYLELTPLVAGMAGVLDELTVPLAIATAKPAAFVAPLLERLEVAARFRFVFAPEMGALNEPKSITVAKALSALGAAEPVMVGDRSFDVVAAHDNAIRAIGVTWGIGDRHELEAAGADAIVERPSDLLALLGPG
jgi:phosphoglycolate phosphatase